MEKQKTKYNVKFIDLVSNTNKSSFWVNWTREQTQGIYMALWM